MIHVIAILTAKPGKRGALLEAFHAIVPAVHAEQGCIEYTPVVDAAGAGAIQEKLGEDAFLVVEKWASMEALEAHGGAPHMADFGAKTKDLVAGRVIHVLTEA